MEMASVIVFRPVAWEYPISSPYGSRIDPVTNKPGVFHYGTDFALPIGTPVVAAADGVIEAASYEQDLDHSAGFGLRVRQIAVINGRRHYVFYGHLSEITVSRGDHVTAGTRIGLSGNTGKTSGPHLHFEVRKIDGKGVPVEFQA